MCIFGYLNLSLGLYMCCTSNWFQRYDILSSHSEYCEEINVQTYERMYGEEKVMEGGMVGDHWGVSWEDTETEFKV